MTWERFRIASLAIALISCACCVSSAANDKPRARDLGVPFTGNPGAWNAITDVPGVEVGYVTLIEGESAKAVRTGVTAILPRGHASAAPLFAGMASLNGNGEMTGTIFIEEFGLLFGPVMLTNTDSVGVARDAVIAWQLSQPSFKADPTELPVVAETWDGRLNDIYGFHIKAEHAISALNQARSGSLAEGNVGGGTGMQCHEFKGGTGTASRRLSSGYSVGVLVQANYGTRETLTVAGVPVGREIPLEKPHAEITVERARTGSIVVIIATDAPLLPPYLKAMAKRATVGLARVGGDGRTSSGDLFLAFSTANPDFPGYAHGPEKTKQVMVLTDWEILNDLYAASAQATEEAIVNALVAADTMVGFKGASVEALPHEKLQDALRKYGRLKLPEASPHP